MQVQEALPPTKSPATTGRLPWWVWVARHPYTTAALVFLISQAFPALLRHHTEWTDVYVAASRNLLAGRDFLGPDGYVYPPFSAMLAIPFSILPQSLSQLLWYLISSACLVYFVKKAWEMSGGGPLQGAKGREHPKEHLIFLVACFCAARFLLNALSHMQTDLVIAALVLAGCLALKSRRSFLAATWIGLAAAFKCTPLLFAPYLAWRGRWLAAVWLVVVAAGVNLLPDLIHLSPSGGLWVTEWYTRYLHPMGDNSYVPGVWATAMQNNQSLAGAVGRFSITSVAWTAQGVSIAVKESTLTAPALRIITCLLYAAVALPSAYALWRRRRTGGPRREAPDADVLEVSIVLLLTLLLSPNSSRAHFGVMLLPAFCVVRIAVIEGNHAAWAMTLPAAFATLISYNLGNSFHIPVLDSLHQITLWAGAVTLTAVLLLAGCVIGLLSQADSSPS